MNESDDKRLQEVYEATLEKLYSTTPAFQKVGASAYKPGLDTMKALDAMLGQPHKDFKTIHVGGTNGKGSVSHALASVLQAAGYRVGLYTSPHLLDFSERIRVNGTPISKEFVIEFVREMEPTVLDKAEEEGALSPSFFELTTAMAFQYFSKSEVDVAVIEVGLGGRLDCTNIIEPELSILTNVSFDHTAQLGNSLEEIAFEKAGIIKKDVPVIVSEHQDVLIDAVLDKMKAVESDPSNLYIAADNIKRFPFETDLRGAKQEANMKAVVQAIVLLQKKGFRFTDMAVRSGFGNIKEHTGLLGRWQQLAAKPRVFCDTAHNKASVEALLETISQQKYQRLSLVFGLVSDKDVESILTLLPRPGRRVSYTLTQPSSERALSAATLQAYCQQLMRPAEMYPTVGEAFEQAYDQCGPDDLLVVFGSNFVVADLLEYFQKTKD